MKTEAISHNEPKWLQPAGGPIDEALAERRARRTWVSFILFLLIGSVGMWVYAAYLAVSDPSMSVVPDYHEKALKWDEHLAAQKASQDLEWTTHLLVQPNAEPAGHPEAGKRAITVFVRDRNAQPVVGLQGKVRYYHHALGKQVTTSELREKEPGTYEAWTTIHREGTWQFETTFDGEGSHFESSVAQDIRLTSSESDKPSP